jgi:ubiquinone/menaquinone biosynthesis C-methylase UbiE
MAKKKRLARFLGSIYWFFIQGRTTMKQSFEDIYGCQNLGPTFRKIYQDAFGAEHSEEADPCGFSTRSDLENIKRCLNIAPDGLLADIACGQGGNGLTIARDLKVRLKGLDLSENAIETAKRRIDHFNMQDRAEFVSGDMRELPYADAEFDAAMCVDTLYMVPDKASALQEVRRVLKPGRRFVVLTWEVRAPLAVKDYRPLMTENGFDVLEYDEVPGWYERQKAVFESILAQKATLIKEMGDKTAALWINCANTELPKLDKMRRVFMVGQSR